MVAVGGFVLDGGPILNLPALVAAEVVAGAVEDAMMNGLSLCHTSNGVQHCGYKWV